MELRHLRSFVAVAEELSFHRAARRVHLSQPSLSRQLAALEAELETRLLERDRRRVELTAAGQLLLGEARAILARTERAAQLVRQAQPLEAVLRVGFTPLAHVDALLRSLRPFHARRPEVRI